MAQLVRYFLFMLILGTGLSDPGWSMPNSCVMHRQWLLGLPKLTPS